jgi:multiple antibiotic resistance protein
MIDIVATFIVFFAVIDPIGTVPVFIAVTRGFSASDKRHIAFIATLTSALILIFFVIAGELILNALSIPLSAFQISGGLVLFIFALSMIFGESKPEEETRIAEKRTETAVYPLSVPSIAGPGAMLTAVLMTERATFDLWQQFQTVLVMLSVLGLTCVLMLLASGVQRLIGNAGAIVISRVMGLILASVATANTLNGIRVYFGIG